MELKVFFTIFLSVFVAELGDKTQLATMLFSAQNTGQRWMVFLASGLGLLAACAIGVLAGALLTQWVSERQLSIVAGSGFILIGLWVLWQAFRTSAA